MNIDKNWFYRLSEIYENNIILGNNIKITIFDDLNKDVKIDIWEWTILNFIWLMDSSKSQKILFNQDKILSQLNTRYLLISENNELKSKIESNINWNNCLSDVKILSIAWENWFIDIDWIIKIWHGIKKVKWNLWEENIFLWETWKIKWIPTLLVRSDDVEASHSCKIEKISEDELFYLRSRWIDKQESIRWMLKAKIRTLFDILKKEDEIFFDEQLKKILKKIN